MTLLILFYGLCIIVSLSMVCGQLTVWRHTAALVDENVVITCTVVDDGERIGRAIFRINICMAGLLSYLSMVYTAPSR